MGHRYGTRLVLYSKTLGEFSPQAFGSVEFVLGVTTKQFYIGELGMYQVPHGFGPVFYFGITYIY